MIIDKNTQRICSTGDALRVSAISSILYSLHYYCGRNKLPSGETPVRTCIIKSTTAAFMFTLLVL